MGGAAIPLMIGAAGTAYQAYSQYKSGQFNKKANDLMAQDAISRGGIEESIVKGRGTRVVAAGTAAAAGANLDVSRGSPVDVAGGTRMMSAFDAALTRANALREAYGYQVRGAIAEAESDNAVKSTLITGAGNLASGAYRAGMFNGSANTGDPSTGTPYYLAAPDASFDPSTLPTFARG